MQQAFVQGALNAIPLLLWSGVFVLAHLICQRELARRKSSMLHILSVFARLVGAAAIVGLFMASDRSHVEEGTYDDRTTEERYQAGAKPFSVIVVAGLIGCWSARAQARFLPAGEAISQSEARVIREEARGLGICRGIANQLILTLLQERWPTEVEAEDEEGEENGDEG
jgi:lysylphosphatidylglycerol synthetase-like protein (DUF2156 family)